jgi:hypothetical protein
LGIQPANFIFTGTKSINSEIFGFFGIKVRIYFTYGINYENALNPGGLLTTIWPPLLLSEAFLHSDPPARLDVTQLYYSIRAQFPSRVFEASDWSIIHRDRT